MTSDTIEFGHIQAHPDLGHSEKRWQDCTQTLCLRVRAALAAPRPAHVDEGLREALEGLLEAAFIGEKFRSHNDIPMDVSPRIRKAIGKARAAAAAAAPAVREVVNKDGDLVYVVDAGRLREALDELLDDYFAQHGPDGYPQPMPDAWRTVRDWLATPASSPPLPTRPAPEAAPVDVMAVKAAVMALPTKPDVLRVGPLVKRLDVLNAIDSVFAGSRSDD
jgi:hypothetical protein